MSFLDQINNSWNKGRTAKIGDGDRKISLELGINRIMSIADKAEQNHQLSKDKNNKDIEK